MGDVAASLRVVRSLQSRGLQWMSRVRSRGEVVRSMGAHMGVLGLDASSLPPAVLIAGTKGKGSTSAMVERLWRCGGLRTGLFTSPHLLCPTERIRVDGEPVAVETYLKAFWESLHLLRGGQQRRRGGPALGLAAAAAAGRDDIDPPDLPGFNFLTLLAFRIFAEARVDVMVLEVGVGGLLDATNTLPDSRMLATGVSYLDYDHMALLGRSLSEIAYQKAGVFRPGVPAAATRSRDEASRVLLRVAAERGTPLWWADTDATLCRRRRAATGGGGGGGRGQSMPALSLQGRFQAANAALAVALVELSLMRGLQRPTGSSSESNSGREKIHRGGLHDTSNRNGDNTLEGGALGCWIDKQSGSAAVSDGLSGSVSSRRAAIVAAAAAANIYQGSMAAQLLRPRAQLSVPSPMQGTDTAPSAKSPSAIDEGGAFCDEDRPLAPWIRDAFSSTTWEGRAQEFKIIVPRRNVGAASQSSAGGVAPPEMWAYLDGAHTAGSISEAALWYRSRGLLPAPAVPADGNIPSSHAVTPNPSSGGEALLPLGDKTAANGPGSPRSSFRPRRDILVFYCGQDKDSLALMLPLIALGPWSAVYFVGVPGTISAPASSDAAGTDAGTKKEWSQYVGDFLAQASERESDDDGRNATSASADGVEGGEEGEKGAADTHIFITGSLYLVGNALRELKLHNAAAGLVPPLREL